MTPNAAHPKPNAADTLPISTDMVSNDSETVPIGTDPSLISNSQQSPDIQVNPAVKSTGLNVSLSANRLPVAVREPPAKPQRSKAIVAAAASQSIRILVIVKRSEVGFEWLCDDLSRFDDDPQRSKHVKRLLLSVATGMDSASLPSTQPSTFATAQRSYRVSFSLSNREIGLEKLFKELSAISTPSERNLHVKRILFNSRTSQTKTSAVIAKQPSEPIVKTALTVIGTGSSLSPWSKPAEPLDSDFKKEATQKENARKRVSSVLSIDD